MSQCKLLDSLYDRINLRIEHSKKVVSIRRNEGFEKAKVLVSTGHGENLMKEVRIRVDHLIDNEEQFLSQRLAVANENFASATGVIITSIVLAIIIVLIALYLFIHDYNKRIESERKLIASEIRIRKILDSLPVGVFIIGTDGVPYYSNTRSTEILGKGIVPGITAEQMTQTYRAYIAGTDTIYPSSRQPVLRALKGENIIGLEDMEIVRDGIRIPIRVNATYITDSDNNIEYAISVFEDITDVKENEKKLTQAKKEAEESVILKETFLANMSHEIRTPMNAIIGFTDLLLKRSMPDQEKDYVRTIKTSGETLLRIINDILDVSKMDSGMMTFEEQPISIKEVFSSLNILLSQKALEKKLNLNFDCDQKIPDAVLGDPTRLTQIILNIVGNAIKFTKKGRVDVFAKVVGETDDSYNIEFSVKDSGIGIPEDKLKFIFERFRQAEAHTTRNYGGTGLGLSIAKQLIELQGGHLSIQSMENVGSIFSFILPFKKTKEVFLRNIHHNAEIDMSKLSKLNMLLVEDNPINIKFVQSLFGLHGLKIDFAENGRTGVEKIAGGNYDIVLMDIEMPEMNGYEATSHIRSELKNPVPIIAMTAHAMAGEKEKCIQLGMNDYISKPINAEVLFEKIIAVTAVNKVDENSITNKLINLDFLSKSVKGNKDLIINIVDIFLRLIPEDLQIINEAVSKADYLTIKNRCHSMRSSMTVMGITVLKDILEEMEMLGEEADNIEKIKELALQLNTFGNQAIDEAVAEKQKLI